MPGAVYYDHIDWYYNFEYAREQSRGLDFQEDLYTPGYFRVSLKEGATLGIIISTSDPSGREACELLAREKARRERLLRGLPDREDDLLQSLALAADQFIILRSSAKKSAGFAGPSIIAGYHWFSDRGRDAMIALPGLCLATRRFKEAKEILHYFSLHVSRGMLPDYFHERGQFNEQEQFSEQGQFAEQGREPEYSTADASLWFIVSAFAYFLESGDEGFVRKDLMPVLLDIIQWYLKGTRCGIKTDRDGLLHVGPRQAGEKRAALTWMDARIGDWIFTPRTGKPVEINALWYNAVRISAELCRRFGRSSEQEAMNRLADRVKKSFQARFWYPEGGYLYDVIDGEGEQQEESLKPNQIFALSLPYPLLSGDKARQIVEIVRQQLVTPRGLRSLAPWDSTYRPLYVGDAFDRDSAYHQGTVWAWLLGPWIRALMRFGGPGAEEEARILVNNFVPHLKEAGLGSVSEIFDAEPPHRARGAIAQAWSVAELLRAVLELQGHSVLSVQGKETGFGSAYSSAQ